MKIIDKILMFFAVLLAGEIVMRYNFNYHKDQYPSKLNDCSYNPNLKKCLLAIK